MQSLLKQALKDKSLTGIRTISQGWEESVMGSIVKMEETSFLINEIDEYGSFIGTASIEMEDVINVDIGDRPSVKSDLDHINITFR
jgi:hypothetical protein